ncbi:MAG: hypothetical protein EBS89_10855 [Proteobacteria bacterium]|nr:hypothetical protein [Pseudomonadota bacterium]
MLVVEEEVHIHLHQTLVELVVLVVVGLEVEVLILDPLLMELMRLVVVAGHPVKILLEQDLVVPEL